MDGVPDELEEAEAGDGVVVAAAGSGALWQRSGVDFELFAVHNDWDGGGEDVGLATAAAGQHCSRTASASGGDWQARIVAGLAEGSVAAVAWHDVGVLDVLRSPWDGA